MQVAAKVDAYELAAGGVAPLDAAGEYVFVKRQGVRASLSGGKGSR